jgi:hypothetical protein
MEFGTDYQSFQAVYQLLAHDEKIKDPAILQQRKKNENQ